MNKQPQLMDASRMRDILTPHLSQIREHVFLDSELAMVRGDHTVFSLLMRQKPPFIINDHRLGIILSGEADINFNLQDRHLTSGTLVYIGPGTIINPRRLSPDLRIFGIGLFSNFSMPFAQGQLPSAFNGQVRDFQLSVDEADVASPYRFSTLSGRRCMLPTTITVPPSQPLWLPRCTTTTVCFVSRLTNRPVAVRASRPSSTASSNWSPSIVRSITRLTIMPSACV